MTSRLKEARELAGYTIDDISKKLNIKKQYLMDIEEENFLNMPGKIYIDGYIKIYSNFLKVNLKESQNLNCKSLDSSCDLSSDNLKKKYRKYILLGSSIMLVLITLIYHLINVG